MREKPHTTRIPSEDPLPEPAETLELSTPVIDMHTRVSSKGGKIPPPLDSEDQRDFAQEDEDALVALEQIEKALRGQLPG